MRKEVLKAAVFTGKVYYESSRYTHSALSGKKLSYAYLVRDEEGREIAVKWSELDTGDLTVTNNVAFQNKKNLENQARINRGIYQIIRLSEECTSLSNIPGLIKRAKEQNFSPKQLELLNRLAKEHGIVVKNGTWVSSLRTTKHLLQAVSLYEEKGEAILEIFNRSQAKTILAYSQNN